MKKLLLTTCLVAFISITSKAQPDTIPNAGFENWYYTPFWTIEANGWQTNNSSIAAWNVFPDSMPHSGLLALQLMNESYRGSIWSGFPLSNHPDALDGFMKNGLGIGDTAFIRIHVYSSSILVDSGYAEIYGGIGTNFFPFIVNISQNNFSADSCVITLEGGNYFGGYVSFDDLSLSFPTHVEEHAQTNSLRIYPIPCTDELTIAGVDELKESSVATLTDVTGKLIREIKIAMQTYRFTISTENLSAGVYVLTINSNGEKTNHLIIKN
ncbi:MAG: T9SS type A sorting domain-containing protein [Bacteroidia bacterium]|nr:T9SS type A sorting domain-containing protein [Bacteroidia bacterium]